ncbi:PAS domain S-box protein [Horticoccus luteus]|uniref:histidine kinase n=1 Tax=Horticoccus luteus TaxID=2862869 RepID=A0A8F9TVY7_9BACT|nr:PAS domain S-box protein [Horticoccus luteus]QYM80085.1 PAS domain S-box protein [Horticoccus luteus]
MNSALPNDSAGAADETLAKLMQQLADAEAALQNYIGKQVDAVSAPQSHPLLLAAAQRKPVNGQFLQGLSSQTLTSILDSFPAHIALLDAHGRILVVNEAWRTFGRANGLQMPDFGLGADYLKICDLATDPHAAEAPAVARGIRAVMEGTMAGFSIEYPCQTPAQTMWFRLVVSPVDAGDRARVVVMHVDITERHRTEIQLREQEQGQRRLAQRLAEAQAVGKVGSWETDIATMTVVWSEETHRIFGTRPDQFQPTHADFLALVHPHDRQRVDDALRSSFTTADRHSIEHRILLRNGRTKMVEEIWRVQFDDADAPVRAVGTCQDITQRKETERLAEEALRFSQTLFASSPLAIIVCKASGEIVMANDASAQVLGAPDVAALKSQNFHSIEVWKQTELPAAALTVLTTGQTTDLEIRSLNSFGREIWLHCWLVPFTHDEKSYLLCYFDDVRDRRMAEEKIRSQHSQMRMAGRLAKVGAWSLSLGQRFCYWSEEVCALHGQPPGHQPTLDEVINYHAAEARPVIRQAIESCRQHGDPFELELQITAATGKSIWISTSGEAVRNQEGVITKIQGAVQDIDQAKRTELELSRSHEDLIKIVGILQEIAHGNISLEDLLKLVVKRVTDFLTVDGVSIELVEGDELACLAATGLLEPTLHGRRPRTEGPASIVLTTLQSIFWRADRPDERVDTVATLKSGVHALMLIPLHDGPIALGLLQVGAQQVDAFTESAFHNMEIVAENLSASMQRIRATEQMRRSEEQYRLLFVSNPLPMWTYNMATLRFLDVNDAAIGHYGYTRDEFLQMTVLDIRAPEDSSELESSTKKLINAGHLRGLRMHRKKSGDIIAVEVSSEPVVLNGRPARLALAQDVTERRRNHARLSEQAALIDAAPVAIIVQDPNHRLKFWSKGAEHLYGWRAEEAIGKSLIELLQPEPSVYEEAIRQIEQQGAWSGEVKKQNKAGELVVVAGQWRGQKNDQGKIESILTIDVDITAQKKIEQQFLRAQRMESIGTLAGGIAHDLNNLLSPILMGVELLRMGPQNENTAMVIGSIERSARRGTDLVKQVLSFARGVEGARIAVKLNHIVRDVQSLIEVTFPKNIRCHTKLPLDLPLITGDPTQLHQVILNLAVNARDAMPSGGDITIQAEAVKIDEQYAVMSPGMTAGQYVCLNFIDTGCGMPPDVLERIFEPFYTTKETGRGTGLGLSTALGIVRSHGGIINVYSEVGHGTSFKIYLPVQVREDAEQSSGSSARDALIRGQGEVVLVVDDEVSILSITQQTLEAFGYRVLTAEDGAQAIGIYATHRDKISVVLTDMMMPVMDGPTLIVALKRINPRVLIVAASGLNANGYIAKVAAAGITDFLPKPYSAEALLKILHHALQKSR